MSNWEIHDNRFVVFLDIMGFKDLISKNPPHNVYDIMLKLNHLRKPIDEFYSFEFIKNLNLSPNLGLKNVMFSDSILISSINDSIDAAMNLLLFCNTFMAHCMKYTIPIKGAIAHGQFTFDSENSIYFGQPLIDAYQLEEDLKLYGIVLHHSFESKIFSFNKDHPFYNDIDHFIIKYKTPLQNKNINHYNLNWIDRAISEYSLEENEVSSLEEWSNKFYKTVSNQPRMYVDNTNDYIKFYFKEMYKK